MPSTIRLVGLLVALACTMSCSVATEGASRSVLDLIFANHVDELAWAIGWRSLLGGLLGLGLGLGLVFGAHRANGFRWNWEHANWLRGLTGVVCVLAFAGAGAAFGFWQGTVRGVETVVVEGPVGSEVLPIVGQAGSTMLAAIYVGNELTCEQERQLDADQQAQLNGRLDGYAAGEWQMEVELLRARLADVQSCVLTLATAAARQQVAARYPELDGTIGDEVIPWLLGQLGERVGAEQVADNPYAKPILAMLASLDTAAARDADPRMLSHRELSEHVLTVSVMPLVMLPVEQFATSQKRVCVIAPLALLLVAIGLFQLAHALHQRGQIVESSVGPGR